MNTANQFNYHPADSRGIANHGWLFSRHTFSFAHYYDPERIHFGALRVLNDDYLAEGMGFGTHPHDNMEIISIPLEGDLEHQDSMGNKTVIKHGDIQVMSAGTGIKHSEYNKNKDRPVKFLQIWVIPNKRNVAPRYDQITLDLVDRRNKLQTVISPEGSAQPGTSMWIHQNAWFHIGNFDEHLEHQYVMHEKSNGVYAFVIKGSFDINGIKLNERDGLEISNISEFTITSCSNESEILLMEVPMEI